MFSSWQIGQLVQTFSKLLMLSTEIAQCRLLLLPPGIKWNLTKAYKFDFSRKILKLHFILMGVFSDTIVKVYDVLVKPFFIIHYMCTFGWQKPWPNVEQLYYYTVKYFFSWLQLGDFSSSELWNTGHLLPPPLPNSNIWLFDQVFKQLCWPCWIYLWTLLYWVANVVPNAFYSLTFSCKWFELEEDWLSQK